MKPTLKDYIKGLSIDDLNDLLFFVIDTLNAKKEKEREDFKQEVEEWERGK